MGHDAHPLSLSDPAEEMLDEVLDDRCVELVADVLTVARRQDEPGVAQDGQVARDRRPARREGLGDLARALGAGLEELEDPPPCRVGQGLEDGVHYN